MNTFDSRMLITLYGQRLAQAEQERRARQVEQIRRQIETEQMSQRPAWWLAWIQTAFVMLPH